MSPISGDEVCVRCGHKRNEHKTRCPHACIGTYFLQDPCGCRGFVSDSSLRADAKTIADAEQRGREAERADARAFLAANGAAFRDVSAQSAICRAIESGKHLGAGDG